MGCGSLGDWLAFGLRNRPDRRRFLAFLWILSSVLDAAILVNYSRPSGATRFKRYPSYSRFLIPNNKLMWPRKTKIFK